MCFIHLWTSHSSLWLHGPSMLYMYVYSLFNLVGSCLHRWAYVPSWLARSQLHVSVCLTYTHPFNASSCTWVMLDWRLVHVTIHLHSRPWSMLWLANSIHRSVYTRYMYIVQWSSFLRVIVPTPYVCIIWSSFLRAIALAPYTVRLHYFLVLRSFCSGPRFYIPLIMSCMLTATGWSVIIMAVCNIYMYLYLYLL